MRILHGGFVVKTLGNIGDVDHADSVPRFPLRGIFENNVRFAMGGLIYLFLNIMYLRRLSAKPRFAGRPIPSYT